MSAPYSDEDPRRTSALAYWRYAHDHLRVARALSSRHRLRNTEAQVQHHLVAQAIEFALKAHLRASGITPSTLADDYRHDLARMLDASLGMGLSPLPDAASGALVDLAAHHGDTEFRHVLTEPHAYPDLDAACQAVHWILDAIAPQVARDYSLHHAQHTSPSTESFVRRLRADLAATSHELLPLE